MRKHKIISKIYLGLILLFLYAPIVTLIVLSFNESRVSVKWGGFSLHWYKELLGNQVILSALWNTLLIATLSAIIATLIGTVTALGIRNLSNKTKHIIKSIANIPLLNAEIVTGISLMLLFIFLGKILDTVGIHFQMGFWTILIGHITFNIPYVFLSVLPRLRQLNLSMYEAALDLGASNRYAFIKVVLPELMPGIAAGFLLAFTMSMDDFVITYFTRGLGADTLSTLIYSELRKGIKPEMYALSSIMFALIFLVLLLINLPWKKEAAHEKI